MNLGLLSGRFYGILRDVMIMYSQQNISLFPSILNLPYIYIYIHKPF